MAASTVSDAHVWIHSCGSCGSHCLHYVCLLWAQVQVHSFLAAVKARLKYSVYSINDQHVAVAAQCISPCSLTGSSSVLGKSLMKAKQRMQVKLPVQYRTIQRWSYMVCSCCDCTCMQPDSKLCACFPSTQTSCSLLYLDIFQQCRIAVITISCKCKQSSVRKWVKMHRPDLLQPRAEMLTNPSSTCQEHGACESIYSN